MGMVTSMAKRGRSCLVDLTNIMGVEDRKWIIRWLPNGDEEFRGIVRQSKTGGGVRGYGRKRGTKTDRGAFEVIFHNWKLVCEDRLA